jgi:hypothetical protein
MAPRNNSTILNLLTKEAPADDAVPKLEGDAPEVKPDPKPGGRRKPVTSKKRAPQAQVNAFADELEVIMKVGAGAWTLRDAHCGPVANQQAREIAEQVADIFATNAAVMHWFDEAVGISGWIKLGKAVAPIAAAVYAHHIAKSVGREEEESHGGFADPLGKFAPWSPGVAAAS